PPGSANFALSATPGNQNNGALDPQETDNVELGTKWSLLNDQLSLTAALFRTENSKQASFDDLLNPLQIGRTIVEGVEIAAVGQLTFFWQVSAGITHMEVDVEDQLSSSGVEIVGVRWTPELSATFWTSYTFGDLTFGGGARYFSDQERNVTASTAPSNGISEIPSYWVADAMAAYRLTEQINLRLNLYNLTDEEYIETLNNGGNRFRLGQPRSVWLTGEYRFYAVLDVVTCAHLSLALFFVPLPYNSRCRPHDVAWPPSVQRRNVATAALGTRSLAANLAQVARQCHVWTTGPQSQTDQATYG